MPRRSRYGVFGTLTIKEDWELYRFLEFAASWHLAERCPAEDIDTRSFRQAWREGHDFSCACKL